MSTSFLLEFFQDRFTRTAVVMSVLSCGLRASSFLLSAVAILITVSIVDVIAIAVAVRLVHTMVVEV
jgi:hypothetical protein